MRLCRHQCKIDADQPLDGDVNEAVQRLSRTIWLGVYGYVTVGSTERTEKYLILLIPTLGRSDGADAGRFFALLRQPRPTDVGVPMNRYPSVER